MYIGDEGSVAQEELERVREAVGEEYAERFARILDRKPERKAERIKEYAENKVFNALRAADFIKAAWEMETDGDGSWISRSAMQEELERKAPAEKVAAWVEGELQDVLKEKGVYNNEDRYTEAGDRKSFEDTHWELSAENIVKAMSQAADRGGTFLVPASGHYSRRRPRSTATSRNPRRRGPPANAGRRRISRDAARPLQ